MLIARHAAIVGGGFSGTLLAINLLRHGALRVTMIERRPDRVARGLAYGGAREGHVLNVRAANMSAFPDRPDHFANWLAEREKGAGSSFATRRDYGAYLGGLLAETLRDCGDRLTVLTDAVVDLAEDGDDMVLTLASGATLAADMVALAPGNLPPHDLPPFRFMDTPAYARGPWDSDIAEALGGKDEVLLIGTGLTAVDCALTLDEAGFAGRITALSRRGLMPHGHVTGTPMPPPLEKPRETGVALVRAVRERAGEVGWRAAVDELRPHTQDIWAAASVAERARFLRHLRPYWDVHRHRLAPQVAGRIAAMRARGQLDVVAGKIVGAREDADGIEVIWRARGRDDVKRRTMARVVNCTGPLGDLTRTRDPLLMSLYAKGAIRPDALGIGIDVDREGRAIRRDGGFNRRLFVVGPMTRGAFWEIVAVPDVRKQVWSLARAVTGAHWVEAEGL